MALIQALRLPGTGQFLTSFAEISWLTDSACLQASIQLRTDTVGSFPITFVAREARQCSECMAASVSVAMWSSVAPAQKSQSQVHRRRSSLKCGMARPIVDRDLWLIEAGT